MTKSTSLKGLSKRPIRLVVIHCTDTPTGRAVSVDEIRRWHVKERGFLDIGYHRIVLLDGQVALGRDMEIVGAHAAGFNANSLGFVYVGRDEINPEQRVSLVRITALACSMNKIDPFDSRPSYGVKGHRSELTKNGSCPGFDMDAFRSDVLEEMKTGGGWVPKVVHCAYYSQDSNLIRS